MNISQKYGWMTNDRRTLSRNAGNEEIDTNLFDKFKR